MASNTPIWHGFPIEESWVAYPAGPTKFDPIVFERVMITCIECDIRHTTGCHPENGCELGAVSDVHSL